MKVAPHTPGGAAHPPPTSMNARPIRVEKSVNA